MNVPTASPSRPNKTTAASRMSGTQEKRRRQRRCRALWLLGLSAALPFVQILLVRFSSSSSLRYPATDAVDPSQGPTSYNVLSFFSAYSSPTAISSSSSRSRSKSKSPASGVGPPDAADRGSGGGPAIRNSTESDSEREQELESEKRKSNDPGGGDNHDEIPLELPSSSSSYEVRWLNETAFPDITDFFSASWLMNMDNFLQTNVSGHNIANVEAGCFGAFRDRVHQLLMSLDWLDFSVEHMSKWWRVLDSPNNPISLNFTVDTFRVYGSRLKTRQKQLPWFDPNSPAASPLHPTLALIAFQPYRPLRDDRESVLEPKHHTMTTASLVATLASLVHVGMGRILVVGYGSIDQGVVMDAFRLLDPSACGGGAGDDVDGGAVCVVGTSELAYARATDDLVKTLHAQINLPRAALAGVMRAKTEVGDENWRRVWLGRDPDKWRYVYLTEPDTFLYTRPSTLQHIKAKLDEGYILVPHRFQPIPHEADAAHTGVWHLVTTDFKNPVALQGNGAACCDAQEGRDRPGRNPNINDGCVMPVFWWQCGYYKSKGNHTRLEAYQFIRLMEGTGIATLAGNEQGRRCIPTFDGPCQYKK